MQQAATQSAKTWGASSCESASGWPRWPALALALGVGLATAGTAGAAPATNISFFQGGSGSAGSLPQQSGVALNVPDNASYAGFALHHVSALLPSSAPSFTYTETGSPSGGGPRLEIFASTGGYAYEYAYPVTADGTTVNAAAQWDLSGSLANTYGAFYNVGWSGVQQAFTKAGATVSGVDLVSDSYTGRARELGTAPGPSAAPPSTNAERVSAHGYQVPPHRR